MEDRICKTCHFYCEGVCKNYDGEYFLWNVRENEHCPEHLPRRKEPYKFSEIVKHLERK